MTSVGQARHPVTGPVVALVVGLCLGLVAGCAADEPDPRPSGPAPAGPRAGTSDTSPEPAPPEALRARCGFPVPGRTFTIEGPDARSTLTAAELGRGRDVAVLVHQTGSEGLCGWLPYAEWAARQQQDRGVRMLLVDACGYGGSVCSERTEGDPAAWLGAVVDRAREGGARRVTLVGASMGGSLAAGVGSRVDVDAVVDLSGPSRWDGVPPVTRAAAALEVPLLAAAAASDTDIDAGALRRAVAAAPAGSRYVGVERGHGWSMVIREGFSSRPAETRPTPLGRLVLAWISGRAGA